MDVLPIEDMSDTFVEHFFIINNFVMMAGLSSATEEFGRGEKMEIYRKVGVSEYWIVDWRKKQVEIYLNDGKEDGSKGAWRQRT